MRKLCLTLAAGAFLLAAPSAWAASATFDVFMTGDQEVPGPGDPDGLSTGTIFLDDVSGLISWNFTYANIAAPSAMHIHNAPFGASAGVFIGLGVATSGGPGTLIDSQIHAPLSDITAILNNPPNFYINIHNAGFPPGAVRDQFPEPTSLALMTLGALTVLRRVRR